MRRWVLLVLLCVGCGTANPVTPEPEPPQELTFSHVPVSDLEIYIRDVNLKYGSIEIFFQEYGWVTREAVAEIVPVYWSRQYSLNMIARIHGILASLHGMRPNNPYLRQLHIEEFEAAFRKYLEGVTLFERNLDFITPELLDALNDHMGAGNVHLIRLQIFLSQLAGREVFLGSQQPF